jgi:hypothetical protein
MGAIVTMPKPDNAVVQEAAKVLAKIQNIRVGLFENMFTLAELLTEAREHSYHEVWGFNRFGDWVEKGSGLDISARTAYYLITIWEKSKELGIPRDQLVAARIAKLKEIFSLDSTKYGDEIKKLVYDAPNSNLDAVRAAVNKLKADGGNIEPYTYITIKIPQSSKETIERSFELVRNQYGDVVDPQTGELLQLSAGKCLEYVCEGYLQDPNNYKEKEKEEEVTL